MMHRRLGGHACAAWIFIVGAAAYGQVKRSPAQEGMPLLFETNAGQTDPSVRFLSRGSHSTLFFTGEGAVFAPENGASALRLSLVGKSVEPVGLAQLSAKVNDLRGSDSARWQTGIPVFEKVQYGQVYPGIDLIYYGKKGHLEYDFVLAPGANARQIQMRFAGATPRLTNEGSLKLNTPAGEVQFEKPVIYQIKSGLRTDVSGGFVMKARGNVGFWLGEYDHSESLIIDPVLTYASYLGGAQANSVNGVSPNSKGELYVTGTTMAANFPTSAGVLQATLPKCKTGDCDKAVGTDAFVSKFSADGATLIYSTYLGGNNDDVGRAITVDANDNAWVTGYTFSNDFPTTSDALQKLCGPSGVFSFAANTFTSLAAACENHPAGESNVYSQNAPDVFIAKLNPAGTQLLYSTFLGGSGNDNPVGIALDAQGNIYVAGNTYSVSSSIYPAAAQVPFPVSGNALQTATTINYGFVSFLTKLSPDGHTLLYSTIVPSWSGQCTTGLCGNTATSLAVGPNGLATIGGFSFSPQLPATKNALQVSCPVNANGVCAQTGFLATIDTTKTAVASLNYLTYLDGNLPVQSISIVSGVAMDAQANIYATGRTTAQNFPTTPGTLSPTCTTRGAGNCYDGFVSKIAPAGTLAWSTYYGSKVSCCIVGGVAIAVDAAQNVYVAGQNGGAYDLPITDPFQSLQHGGEDIFIAALSADGARLLFGSYFGGTANETVTSIALDAARNIYLGGYTGSVDLPVTPGAFQMSNPSGFQQGFAAKIAAVPIATTPGLLPGGIISAGAFGGFATAAPGSWIEIYGTNLAPVTREWGSADFNGANAPVSLGGVSVNVGGQAAFVDFISPGQVNALIPSNAPVGSTMITVTNAAGTTAPYPFTLNSLQPGLLAPPSLIVGGLQYAGALFPNSQTFALPAGALPGVASRPAKPGDTLIFYGVGFGAVTPTINAGTVVSQSNALVAPFKISFGTTPAAVTYQGLAPGFTGLYQFNVVVPSVPDNPATALTFSVGGQTVTQPLAIAISQ
jgi:uncharacterized protein (TIGR03437 family)